MDKSDCLYQNFRIGATTTAAVAGTLTWMINSLGHWTNNAYLSYSTSIALQLWPLQSTNSRQGQMPPDNHFGMPMYNQLFSQPTNVY